ncbi:uncharacterized protein KY384_005579 [Bacidia gigantensis]|uniref:uncharacterized protein n=1 Tax=Bacidia gigantensis TaxID=2732470 RepID=UPI001D054B32|nr:uncharacterized protein KY384_005579 [Bacidia gigantensis]KAG8530097.1 hypothetical protein KY384_005579 [Bacidia gigantensis]
MTKNTPKTIAQATNPDILILGLGWTSQFLLPLLRSRDISYAGTTRSGRNDSIPLTWDPFSDSVSNPNSIEKFSCLPGAKTVLITFPLGGRGRESIRTFLEIYFYTHKASEKTRWILFGSTGVFKGEHWNDETSPQDESSERWLAEDQLLCQEKENACILNLAGLHGGERQVKNWIVRVAKTKEAVKGKTVVHLVHGLDVARAVVLCLENWESVDRNR